MKLGLFAFLLSSLFSNFAMAGEKWAVLLSGGIDPQNNFYSYYDSTSRMFSALRANGVQRDHIMTLYADGGAKGADTIKANPWTLFSTNLKIDTAPSLEGDQKTDLKDPATRKGLEKTIEELASKAKPGDHLFFFITDHGGKQDGIYLWNNESYSVQNLRSLLSKLPKGVRIHLATNICYGGQFLELTGENVCVIANTDAEHVNYSHDNKAPFVIGFSDAIRKAGRKKERISFLEAFYAGREADIPLNKNAGTSVDWFIEKQNRSESDPCCPNCRCQDLSPIERLQGEISEISEISNTLEKAGDSRKTFYEKSLKERIAKLSQSLITYRNRYSNYQRNKYQKQMSQLKKRWESLPEKQREVLRPSMTGLAEKLRTEDEFQKKKLEDLEGDHKRALAELRFLRSASPEQLAQYDKIKSCLDDEI